MSARIFVLCLLSSVISTEAALKCQSCLAIKGECKNEDMQLVECQSGEDYCLTLSLSSSMIKPTQSFTYKGCARADQCNQTYYSLTSVANKFHQLKIACCETDNCNTAPLPIPSRELMKPNGFSCPGSYEENGSSEESGLVLCLNDENQCFSTKFETHAMSTYHSSVTVQGCTTKNTCAYPIGETEYGHGLLRFKVERMECKNPERLEGWNIWQGWN